MRIVIALELLEREHEERGGSEFFEEWGEALPREDGDVLAVLG